MRPTGVGLPLAVIGLFGSASDHQIAELRSRVGAVSGWGLKEAKNFVDRL